MYIVLVIKRFSEVNIINRYQHKQTICILSFFDGHENQLNVIAMSEINWQHQMISSAEIFASGSKCFPCSHIIILDIKMLTLLSFKSGVSTIGYKNNHNITRY